MARKLKKVENETQTLYDQEYGEKQWKTWKSSNAQSRIWNKARKLKIIKLRSEHVGPENGEKTEICGKWQMHIVGPGMWQETQKIMENEKCIM